jgi:hypothetical protein
MSSGRPSEALTTCPYRHITSTITNPSQTSPQPRRYEPQGSPTYHAKSCALSVRTPLHSHATRARSTLSDIGTFERWPQSHNVRRSSRRERLPDAGSAAHVSECPRLAEMAAMSGHPVLRDVVLIASESAFQEEHCPMFAEQDGCVENLVQTATGAASRMRIWPAANDSPILISGTVGRRSLRAACAPNRRSSQRSIAKPASVGPA